MHIFRNRETKMFIIVLLALAAAGALVCFFISVPAGIVAFITSLLLISAVLLFTRWRYKQIEKLNEYLKKTNSGNYALDVRDNVEGELSILKNELYKVTVMLRQQNDTLAREKSKLADAVSDISHQLKTPLTFHVHDDRPFCAGQTFRKKNAPSSLSGCEYSSKGCNGS